MMAHAVIQALAVVSFAAWASLSTLVILRVIDTILPLRAGKKHEWIILLLIAKPDEKIHCRA